MTATNPPLLVFGILDGDTYLAKGRNTERIGRESISVAAWIGRVKRSTFSSRLVYGLCQDRA